MGTRDKSAMQRRKFVYEGLPQEPTSGGLEAVSFDEIDEHWADSEWGQNIVRARFFSHVVPPILGFSHGDAFLNLCARDAFLSCVFAHEDENATCVNVSLSGPAVGGDLFWFHANDDGGAETQRVNTNEVIQLSNYLSFTKTSSSSSTCIEGGRNVWMTADVFSLDKEFVEFFDSTSVKVFCFPPSGISTKQILERGVQDVSNLLQSILGVSTGSGEWRYAVKAIQLMQEGKACVIMTEGSLWGGQSHDARRAALERRLVEAVILIPKILFPGDDRQRAMVVFSKNNATVRFADFSEDYQFASSWMFNDYYDEDHCFEGGYVKALGEQDGFSNSFFGAAQRVVGIAANDVIKAGATFDARFFCDEGESPTRSGCSVRRLGTVRRGTSKAKLTLLDQSPISVKINLEDFHYREVEWNYPELDCEPEYPSSYPTAALLGLGDIDHGAIFGDAESLGIDAASYSDHMGKVPFYCLTHEEMVNGSYGVVSGTHLIVARTGEPVKVALYLGNKYDSNNSGGKKGLHDGIILADNLLCIDLSESRINPVFVLAFFRSDAGQLALRRKMKGRTLKQLSSRDLGDLIVPNPSADVQRAISEAYLKLWKEIQNANREKRVAEKGLDNIAFMPNGFSFV